MMKRRTFSAPKPLQESERDAIMAVIDRIKRADARHQSSQSPIREVTKTEKKFQEDSKLPVEFFDFFEIKPA